MAVVTLRGSPVHTCGELPRPGDAAPDFLLVDTRLRERRLADYRGRRKLLSIVPSLDTPVCASSTRKFDEQAPAGAVMLVISADLPFAMQRFCKEAGLKGVEPLSMMRSRSFAKDYGVLIQDGPLAGITARAVVVLDENDRVLHSELVAEIGDEPDYDSALAALLA